MILHRVWLGGPLPPHLEAYGRTWQEHHPDWEHWLWTDDKLPRLRNQALFDGAERLTVGNPQQLRADIVRYELLAHYGGVYVDCDFECLKPIDELAIDEPWAAWEVDNVWVNNAILGAPAGHTMLHELISGLPASIVGRQRQRPNVLSGPQYMTPVAKHHNITVYPSKWFYPYLWNELDRQSEVFPDAYAVHHWHNQRQQRAREAG